MEQRDLADTAWMKFNLNVLIARHGKKRGKTLREVEFEAYARGRKLADRTISQRIYALKRIERAHGIDLDAEFESDGMRGILSRFSFTASDARIGTPNPTQMDIEADKLLVHLRWYRSHLADYARFSSGNVPLPGEPIEDEDGSEDLLEEVVGKTFALERDLQAALRGNIGQLEEGLAIIDDGAERRIF